MTARIAFRTILVASAAAMTVVIPATQAMAQWSVSGAGSGGAAATTMPAGATPAAAATGSTVSVRWAAVTLPDGTPVDGYVVNRINAINGQPATVGPGCAGVVTTTTCAELSVPSGTWVYTDTPVYGNWFGAASSPSSAVTV